MRLRSVSCFGTSITLSSKHGSMLCFIFTLFLDPVAAEVEPLYLEVPGLLVPLPPNFMVLSVGSPVTAKCCFEKLLILARCSWECVLANGVGIYFLLNIPPRFYFALSAIS